MSTLSRWWWDKRRECRVSEAHDDRVKKKKPRSKEEREEKSVPVPSSLALNVEPSRPKPPPLKPTNEAEREEFHRQERER